MSTNNWTTLLTVIGSVLGAGGLLALTRELLKWLAVRRKDNKRTVEEERESIERGRVSYMGELRGEIHSLREQKHLQGLQLEVAMQENAALKAKLHVLEQRLGSLSSESGTAFVTIDHYGKVVAWSPSAVELFGWTASDAVGKNLTELIVPEEHAALHAASMRQCFAEDRPPRSQPLILTARNKWGHEFLVDVALSGTKTNGAWFYTGQLKRRYDKFD